MRTIVRLLTLCALAGTAACSDVLEVQNPNAADRDRALGRPIDVENLIAASYNSAYGGLWNNTGTSGANISSIWPQVLVLGMENYSNLANFGMSNRAQIPRPPIQNNRGIQEDQANTNFRAYLMLHRAMRSASLGLAQVNRPDFTFFPTSPTQVERARSFAHFVIGFSAANIAMLYDSGSVVTEADQALPRPPLEFVAYDSLMRFALARLDSAIAVSNAMGALVIPSAWMRTPADVTPAQFQGLVRAWKARFRAGVARNPAERALVDWAAVRDDALAGAAAWPADIVTRTDPAQGWDAGWLLNHFQSNSVNWHMMWQYMVGMADGSGAYDAWLATAPAGRAPFLIQTADRRFPAGATRAEQQAVAVAGNVYFQNRATGDDWVGDPSANSQYRHARFLALRNAGRVGNYPLYTTAEMNLLAAEAHYRLGAFGAAAALIDLTRVGRGQLPALAGVVSDATTPVPGGASCVPRVPSAPSFTSSACGTLLEALKWEKRIETAYTNFGNWFLDGRGWGDLPAGTPVQWPVPFQEMDSRQRGFYPSTGAAAAGNYGL